MSFLDLLRELQVDFFRHGIDQVPLEEVLNGDASVRIRFVKACHEGFRLGQPKLVRAIVERETKVADLKGKLKAGRQSRNRGEVNLAVRGIRQTEYEIAILRKVADTVAWMLCNGQHWIVRRLYVGRQTQLLSATDWEAELRVADKLSEGDPTAFALISDCTSFVQVGDLLAAMPAEVDGDELVRQGLAIIELKTGEKNATIRELLTYFYETGCPAPLIKLSDEEGPKTAKQIRRMNRQDIRGHQVAQAITNEGGTDLLTGREVQVFEDETVEFEDYEDLLADIVKSAQAKGEAWGVVDDCLLIGGYDPKTHRNTQLSFIHDIFHYNSPDKECPDPEGADARAFVEELKPNFPIVRLADGIYSPLAMPLFMRRLPMDDIDRVLLREIDVYLYLDYDKFAELARASGLEASWIGPRELSKRDKESHFRVGNRVLRLSHDGIDLEMGSGIPVRIFYDGIRPSSAIALLRAQLVYAANSRAEKGKQQAETVEG